MSELINIVNEKDKIVGKTEIEEAHRKNFLHRAVHIFVINSEGKLFCRRRSFNKPRYRGYWSTGVGAHVLSGQTYSKVALKALKETLGISCKLKMIGKARVHDKYENEISATYIGYSNKKLRFNKRQIEGGEFFTIKEIKKLTKQKNVTPHLKHSLKLYLKYRKKH